MKFKRVLIACMLALGLVAAGAQHGVAFTWPDVQQLASDPGGNTGGGGGG